MLRLLGAAVDWVDRFPVVSLLLVLLLLWSLL